MSDPERARTAELLNRLLAERGIERYALFLVQQEGITLPGGIEALSGFVLTTEDQVYGFWLDWDQSRRKYVLEPWYAVEDPNEFAADAEYLEARRRLHPRA